MDASFVSAEGSNQNVRGPWAWSDPREAEDAFGHDVALDLVGAGVDGTGQREEPPVEPTTEPAPLPPNDEDLKAAETPVEPPPPKLEQ